MSKKTGSSEKWRSVNKFYEVSSSGRVRRVSGVDAQGRMWPGRILKQNMQKGRLGHCSVMFWIKGKSRRMSVHRLVLEAFIGPCPPGMEACHNDGNPRNNALSNLRWDTSENNSADKIRHGRANRGERHGLSYLKANVVKKIRKMHKKGIGYKKLAKLFNIPWGTARNIAANKTWRYTA